MQVNESYGQLKSLNKILNYTAQQIYTLKRSILPGFIKLKNSYQISSELLYM